jgi:Ser/Thr protein kinase RdoA (MazF antagonist)
MSVFPTQYSTLSAAALAGYIGENYGFENLSGRLLIRNVSDTYLLEDPALTGKGPTTKYIFKVYRIAHRTLPEIQAEVELLNVLKEKGASVAYAIRDLQGRQIQHLQAAEGIRHGVLFYFAPGKPSLDLTNEQLRTIGREIAILHNITATIELQHPRSIYDIRTTLLQPLKVIAPHWTNMGLAGELSYLQETAEKVIEKMASFDTAAFSYGYCHYDTLPKNFHFDERDGLVFFDFDFAGKGYLANDIMVMYIHFFFHVHGGRISQEMADRDFGVFLEAYREVRPLSVEEVQAVPCLGFMWWVYFLEFFQEQFDDFSNVFLTPRFLRDRVALIRKWMDQYQTFALR